MGLPPLVGRASNFKRCAPVNYPAGREAICDAPIRKTLFIITSRATHLRVLPLRSIFTHRAACFIARRVEMKSGN
jgi:hypothetical protein